MKFEMKSKVVDNRWTRNVKKSILKSSDRVIG